MLINTIYLCHHSHTDIGYTHDQPVVEELHSRFIDKALDLIDANRDRGPATFRWTCEVTAPVQRWLKTASPKDVQRFAAAAERGQLEVCALKYNLTPLASLERIIESLEPVRRLRRDLGLNIRVAMNSDVNGQSWGLADALLDAGIDAMTMSINEHFGHAPRPCPGALAWRAPSGRALLTWNGQTYAHTAWLGLGLDLAAARKNVEAMARALDEDGYPLPLLYMQITHPGPQNDNMGPIAHLSDWVEQFNAASSGVRLEITTPSAFMDALRGVKNFIPPVVRGDWTDWWNFGAASTPIETTVNLASQHRLRDADLLACASPQAPFARLRDRAAEAIDLWNEHTWGADCSVNRPGDPDTTAQKVLKLAIAYQGRALSTLLRRDGLTALAARIQTGRRPGVLVFNPTPYPRSEVVTIPRRVLGCQRVPQAFTAVGDASATGWPDDPAYQHLLDRNAWQEAEAVEVGPIALPPFGWSVVTEEDAAAPSARLDVRDHTIAMPTLSVRWDDDQAGIRSLRDRRREWVAPDTVPFGVVIAEEVSGGRKDVMRFDDAGVPARTRQSNWNADVPLQRRLPNGDYMSSVQQLNHSAVLTQTYAAPTCRGVVQRWRLLPDTEEVELTVEIDKLAVTDPHGLYLALPFNLDRATTLAQVAGAVIDADQEQVPGSAPWLSLQGGFCLGDDQGSVYVATPDTSLLQLRRFRIGRSHVEGRGLDHPGLALVWLYNNLWETNFAADAAGIFRFRFVLGFTQGGPDAGELVRFCDRAARRPLIHPLPPAARVGLTSLPQAGQLLDVQPGPVQLLALSPALAGPAGEAVMLLFNPTGESETFKVGSAAMQITAAVAETSYNDERRLPVERGALSVVVPSRRTLAVRLQLDSTAVL